MSSFSRLLLDKMNRKFMFVFRKIGQLVPETSRDASHSVKCKGRMNLSVVQVYLTDLPQCGRAEADSPTPMVHFSCPLTL